MNARNTALDVAQRLTLMSAMQYAESGFAWGRTLFPLGTFGAHLEQWLGIRGSEYGTADVGFWA